MLLSILFSLIVLAAADPATVPFSQSSFQAGSGGVPSGWRTWAARDEIAPRTFVDSVYSREGFGSLAISGDSNGAAYGGWERLVSGVEAGRWYRFTAYYRSMGLDYEPWQVVARLNWKTADGKRAGRPEYPYHTERVGDWVRLTHDVQAPEKAGAVNLELYLQNAPQATVWWDEISFEAIPDPGSREVTIASLYYRPGKQKRPGSAKLNIEKFIRAAEKAIPGEVDLIVFPEATSAVDTGLSYADVADTIPGAITRQYGELARRKNSYIVAGIDEREGAAVYNSAVLINREGQVIGKYRKVYIPREEIEVGITPGTDYPVFDTDFGCIGMMICWDVQYPEPARALALRGAEILLLPIWDGNETLTAARAIENQVYLVTSSYGAPTQILNPNGEQIALAPEVGSAAIATIDLNKRLLNPWLGDMRARSIKEYRGDVSVKPIRMVR
jgi:predicted amidohydrolase